MASQWMWFLSLSLHDFIRESWHPTEIPIQTYYKNNIILIKRLRFSSLQNTKILNCSFFLLSSYIIIEMHTHTQRERIVEKKGAMSKSLHFRGPGLVPPIVSFFSRIKMYLYYNRNKDTQHTTERTVIIILIQWD